jgi:hypothetical protein
MATLAGLTENGEMGDEMKEIMGSETEMNKFIPTVHCNECSFYDLIRFSIRFLFESGAIHRHTAVVKRK